MKLTILAVAGAISALAMGAQSAQAHVTCAYLTRDGYCVRPHKTYQKQYVHKRHYYQRVYRPYEPAPADDYYWRYERPRPIIRVVPDYRPPYDDNWSDDWND